MADSVVVDVAMDAALRERCERAEAELETTRKLLDLATKDLQVIHLYFGGGGMRGGYSDAWLTGPRRLAEAEKLLRECLSADDIGLYGMGAVGAVCAMNPEDNLGVTEKMRAQMVELTGRIEAFLKGGVGST